MEGYNNRLQLAETYDSLDNVNSTANMLFSSCLNWGVNPNYGASLYPLCPVSSATTDNGTLQSATFTAGGPQYSQLLSFTQTFGYDNLNRLTSVNDSGGYARTFGYDQWGNMWVAGHSGGPWSGTTPITNVFTNNRMNGVSYDTSGNQLIVNGNALTYDAENRLSSETDGVTGAKQNYLYDGDGRRVQKSVAGGVSTTYVYDVFGQLAAEYTTASNSMPCTTCYVASDHLGSTRLVMDQNGGVVARHDYLPFGEEVGADSGRNSQWNTGNDTLAQKFTGKEHDSETGLNYFGVRYYGAALGRFTSPDLPFADQKSNEPQSWNLYTYARNNPLTYIDDTGRAIELSTDSEQRQLQLRALQEALGMRAGSYLYDNVEKDKAGNPSGRHFVGILSGGPSGKGPDFASINSVAMDIASVVADSQIVQIHLLDAGQSFLPMGAGHDPASLDSRYVGYTSPFNAPPPIQIWLLNPASSAYDDIGPWAMSDGRPGVRSLPDNFLHELGHAAWQMNVKSGRQVNPADPYGKRRSVDFENDVRRLRGGAERLYHDTPGDAAR